MVADAEAQDLEEDAYYLVMVEEESVGVVVALVVDADYLVDPLARQCTGG